MREALEVQERITKAEVRLKYVVTGATLMIYTTNLTGPEAIKVFTAARNSKHVREVDQTRNTVVCKLRNEKHLDDVLERISNAVDRTARATRTKANRRQRFVNKPKVALATH